MLIAAALLAGCAARHLPPELPIPPPEPGKLSVRATAPRPIGPAQPVAVAVTNGRDDPLRLDPQQIFASSDSAERVLPLAPAEAAPLARGHGAPGAVRGGAVGALTGGLLGAVAGAISGAIQGGIGAAVAVGSAVGAAVGAIGGVIGGSREPAPEVAAFEERARNSATLAQGFSATGYVYYPAGSYRSLEMLLVDERSGAVIRERVPIAAPE